MLEVKILPMIEIHPLHSSHTLKRDRYISSYQIVTWCSSELRQLPVDLAPRNIPRSAKPTMYACSTSYLQLLLTVKRWSKEHADLYIFVYRPSLQRFLPGYQMSWYTSWLHKTIEPARVTFEFCNAKITTWECVCNQSKVGEATLLLNFVSSMHFDFRTGWFETYYPVWSVKPSEKRWCTPGDWSRCRPSSSHRKPRYMIYQE